MKHGIENLTATRMISQFTRPLLIKGILLSTLVFAASCETEFDKYYERPSWLEEDAYKVLKSKGNFTHYLELVDRTLYSKILHGSGSYTIFAPNNVAFEKYLKLKNYSSVKDIPINEASDIVSYSMLYNQYTGLNLGNTWLSSSEWSIGSSVRKKTPSYKGIYKDKVNGDSVYVFDAYSSVFDETIHDNRYLSVFTPAYFTSNALKSSDYNQFYSSEWGSIANVFGSQIIESDIYCSNGVVHETDMVIEVPMNIDAMIMQYAEDASKSSQGWIRFKELLKHKYSDGNDQFIIYQENKDASTYYKKVYPEKEAELSKVYSRQYDLSQLGCNPNIEEFIVTSEDGGTSETNGYTLFLPSASSIDNYFKNTILRYTDNIDNLPSSVISTFLRSHLSRTLVWPSKYNTSKNKVGTEGEFINGAGASGGSFEDAGVISSEFASNGIVYQIKDVIKSGLFESVYGRILLDPNYSFVNILIGGSSLFEKLTTSTYTGYNRDSYNYTVILPSDELLKEDGFSYNSQKSVWENSVNSTIDASVRISRLVNSGIFVREVNGDVNPELMNNFQTQPAGLQGEYDGYGYVVNNYGDMIRYRNNQLQAIGNIQDGTVVNIKEDEYPYCNGQVYTMDKLLNYTPRDTYGGEDKGWNQETLSERLSAYLALHNDVSIFKSYYDICNTEIEFNSSSFHTLLIPTNERMNEAISKGYLPALADVITNGNGELYKAVAFLNAHFITGGVYPDDGLNRIYPGNYAYYSMSTLNKITESKLDLVFAKTYAAVSKSGSNNILKFLASNIESGKNSVVIGYNSTEGTNTVIRGIENSNIMGPKAVIHKLDGFLYFAVNESLLNKD